MLPFPTQLDVRLADRDARWHCERFFTLTLAGGQVDMFFIDTSPGVASYRTAPWAANPGVFPCIMDVCLLPAVFTTESIMFVLSKSSLEASEGELLRSEEGSRKVQVHHHYFGIHLHSVAM